MTLYSKNTFTSASLLSVTTLTLMISACGGGGSSDPGTGGSPPTQPGTPGTTPAPTVTLMSSTTSVASPGSVTLTWSSTNAASCSASSVPAGTWTGTKATSGSEAVANLTQNTQFTLTCTGGGGAGNGNVQVTVTSSPPSAPTATLSALPTSVSVNGTTTLSWSSANATSCTASSTPSGAWSGTKATTGAEASTALSANTTFSLTCTNGTASSSPATASVTVTTAGGNAALSGKVDSSYIDLGGQNRVYVFAGANATPRDYRGTAGDPVLEIPVLQDDNACTFSYATSTLAPGPYTLAFTSQADNHAAAETLTFVGTTNVTVGSSTIQNLASPTILRVGSGKTYATIAAAAAAANSGNVIEVDAGTYNDDVVTWSKNNITVRGIGGLAHVHGTHDIGNGKGLFVVSASRIRVENLEFSGATVTDENGAGIRDEGANTTICNSSFHDNQNGILADDGGTLTVEYSTLANNGLGDGFTHNIYVGSATTPRLVFRYNYSHHAKIGHTLKSRARENYILYNRIMDEATGTGSYTIDITEGGLAYVIGNLLQQGPNTDNSILLNYGSEGVGTGRTNNFYLINNTIVNDRDSGTFVDTNSSASVFVSMNNYFVGGGTIYGGKQPTATTNATATLAASALVSLSLYDYRPLASASALLNKGTAPGSGNGFSLVPVYEYVHPARRQPRETDATLDIGAYEFP